VLYCTIVNPTGDCIDLRLREAPLVGHRSVSGKLFYIGCVLLNVLEYTKVRELIPVMAVVYSARAGNNGLDFILEADAGHDANALGGFTVRRIANGYHIFAGTQVGERRLILERSSIDTVCVRRFAADGRNGDRTGCGPTSGVAAGECEVHTFLVDYILRTASLASIPVAYDDRIRPR